MKTITIEFDRLSEQIVASVSEVHRKLGPGLLPSVYAQCLTQEFKNKWIPFKVVHPQMVHYKGAKISCDAWIDVIVDGKIFLELKNVHQFFPVHEIQLIASMKKAKTPVGLFIDFNVRKIAQGIRKFSLPNE